MPLIVKSATMALLALLGSSAIAAFLNMSMGIPTFEGGCTIPLSIMSSAIIIPSVAGLGERPRIHGLREHILGHFWHHGVLHLLGNSMQKARIPSLLASEPTWL